MKINRRRFLQGSAIATASALGMSKNVSAMETALGNESYNYIKRGEKRERVFSCSPLHAHDNPVHAWVDDDPMLPNNPLTNKSGRQVVEISGVTESVRSRGRVSAAEVTSWLQLYDGDRVLSPLKRVGKRGSGRWRKISWQQALKEIAGAIKASKPEEIALMRGKDTSAGVWERFMHTLGSSTVIDLDGAANQRAAWQAAWHDGVSVPDLAHSHYILNFGSNFFVSHPDYAAEALDGRHLRRARIITFDPRCSKTAGLSDEWVPVRPGTDGVVALAMVRYLLEMGWADRAAIKRFSSFSAESLAKELTKYTLDYAAKISGVPAETIRRIAREFGDSEGGCILTGAGISGHANGYHTEQALMLLPLVTGYIEVRGGNCLPRRLELGAIKPAPRAPNRNNPVKHPQKFPVDVGDSYSVGMLFSYNTNPAFEAPAAVVWRKALGDLSRVRFSVAIGTFRNETSEMADLILPEAHWLERNEPVQGEGTLLPWVSLRQQVVPPPGEVKELREILRDIIHTTGDREKMRYWQLTDTRQWMGQQLEGVAGLKGAGGWELMARHSGVWPIYGYLHPEIRRIVDEQGEEVMPEYGRQVKIGIESFPHWEPAADVAAAKSELTLLVHDSDYHAGDASANNKVIMENSLANHLHVNVTTANRMKIRDGDLIRVISKAGYLVTRAHLTQTIHPEAVAMHRDGGHWAIGGVASGEAGPGHHNAPVNIDADIAHNLWWTDIGVHPMDIILPVFDETGGGAATATAIRIEQARQGDEYGMVNVDLPVVATV
ncbi:MAG: molybdopterin-dependent oxidoreductase [Mariprofundaceae bacterium]|nr:molybdopterin-dependent oxidoreductase [Mariprofundaceae bacterium]